MEPGARLVLGPLLTPSLAPTGCDQQNRAMPGFLKPACDQQLHQMADVKACRCRIKTHIRRHRPAVQMGRKSVHVRRFGYKATPGQFIKQCIHPARLVDRPVGIELISRHEDDDGR